MTATDWLQGGSATGSRKAETVRSVRSYTISTTVGTADAATGGRYAGVTDPSRLPPGTPQFEYIKPTGFRQTF